MLTAIALDDEPPALSIIENFSSKVENLQLQKTFTMPNEALAYLRKFPVDLIFLDIQMPSINGFEFYKSLDQELMVIFTTAYSEYAVEGFNVRAVDYLLKPFTLDRFAKAVSCAGEKYELLRQKNNVVDENIFIRADYKLIKIPLSEIIFIEGLDDYLKIHLVNKKPVVARMTMKVMMEKLNTKEFVRIHRSFIVPVSKIDSIRNKMVYIGDQEIPVGITYEENFFRIFSK
ncbi:MAG: LytTR family DNA-binding domain-containing protein [Bacteroidota bacterium]